MSRLCRVFGHRGEPGSGGGAPYMTVAPGPVDGIGRYHGTIYHVCERCKEKYRVGYLHLNSGGIARAVQDDPDLFGVAPKVTP